MAELRPAVRAPSDVLRLVTASCAWALLIVAEVLFGSDVAGFASELLRGVDAVSTSVLTTVVAGARAAAVVALVVLAVAAIRSGGVRMLAALPAGLLAGAVAYAVAEATIDARAPALVALEDVAPPLTSGTFPTGWGLCLGTSALVTVAPWVPRTLRRLGWGAALALTAGYVLAAPLSATPLAALVSGWLGGSVAVVLFGAPAMRPTIGAVVTGLRSTGLDVTVLEPAKVDARGSTPYLGRTADGDRVFVKVLGRDERSADLLFRLYRWVIPASFGDERPFSSLRRAVEHEALVSLAVASFGVRTPAVLALASVEPDGYALAYQAVDGRSLDAVAPSQLTDEVIGQAWSQVAILRHHRAAHRDLRLANLFLGDDGAVWLIDFGFAELATSPMLLASDVAELLAALGGRVPPERVLATARTALGDSALIEARARLQPRLLSGATRGALREHPGLAAALRGGIDG